MPLGRLAAAFSRAQDRVPTHAPETVLALDDRPPPAQTLALALQQLAIQSIYFVLPGVVAAAFGATPLEATNYLCLSLLVLALWTVLQGLARGPVGSGYPIPAIPSPVMLAPLLLAAALGASMAEAAVMVVLVGVVTILLSPAIRRIAALLPTEVMGVVVFLIGASLLPNVMSILRLDPAQPYAAAGPVALAGCCFAVMVIVGVLRWRFARYALLIGALVGSAGALLVGMVPPGAGALLSSAPWFAVPQPALRGEIRFDASLLVSFLLCTLSALASLLGALVAFQKGMDGGWTRADPGPLRRGILAHGIAVALAGTAGAMPAAASSASVGVSIATRTFARSIALAGATILCVLAFSPKVAALFVLVPAPVQAAMLLYVAGFMMAQGCEMAVTRTLDTRRTVVAGLGLSAGLCALAAPAFFAAALPALAAPLAVGGIAAFVANLLTLPLMKREDVFVVGLGPASADLVMDRCFAVGGAWALRPETVRRMQHALLEMAELLAGRGLPEMTVRAVQRDQGVRLVLAFAGAPLPRPTRRPTLADLEAGGDALEASSLWLALRETSDHGMRGTAEGQELWLDFED